MPRVEGDLHESWETWRATSVIVYHVGAILPTGVARQAEPKLPGKLLGGTRFSQIGNFRRL